MAKNKEKKRKTTFGDIIRNIIMIIALCVFLYSGYQLFTIFMEYKAGRDEYTELADLTVGSDLGVDIDLEEEFPIDFAELLEINPDTVGWIHFDEPEIIDYPIVQGTDNDYYLKHTFKKEPNNSGAIFMDCDNDPGFYDPNTFIYGHNMRDRSMFSQIKNYRDKEYWEENPYFYIYTVDERIQKYEIFSAHVVNAYDDSYLKYYQHDEAFQEYLDMIIAKSAYSTGIEVTAEDTIVSLSTCTSRVEDERFLLHGRLITEE